MKRREALKTSAFLAGCGLSAGTIAAIVSGCQSEPSLYPDAHLGEDHVRLLGEIVETIIPTTDTPGAKAAEVHLFIDQVSTQFTEDELVAFKAALDEIDKGNGKKFAKMSSEEREEYLLSIEAKGGDKNPYNMLRGLTCQGYFTSEIGATKALAYDPIPGEYKPCIELSEVGKAWAL